MRLFATGDDRKAKKEAVNPYIVRAASVNLFIAQSSGQLEDHPTNAYVMSSNGDI